MNDQVNFNLDALDINLLDEEMPREIKIIVMGEINSGKSSLIQIFFGQQSPVDILSRESEPTIGAEINVFENNDAKVGVFDLAGQEFDNWLSHRNNELFYETDGVLLVLTLSNDLKKKKIDQISRQINKVLKNKAPQAKCIVILNKYDEYFKSKAGTLKKANHIKRMVEEVSGFPTYISSLIPSYFPLLQMKLDKLLQSMPVETPSVEIFPAGVSITPPESHLTKESGHIIKKMSLADAEELIQDEYNQRISRMEILQSEFSIR